MYVMLCQITSICERLLINNFPLTFLCFSLSFFAFPSLLSFLCGWWIIWIWIIRTICTCKTEVVAGKIRFNNWLCMWKKHSDFEWLSHCHRGLFKLKSFLTKFYLTLLYTPALHVSLNAYRPAFICYHQCYRERMERFSM